MVRPGMAGHLPFFHQSSIEVFKVKVSPSNDEIVQHSGLNEKKENKTDETRLFTDDNIKS